MHTGIVHQIYYHLERNGRLTARDIADQTGWDLLLVEAALQLLCREGVVNESSIVGMPEVPATYKPRLAYVLIDGIAFPLDLIRVRNQHANKIEFTLVGDPTLYTVIAEQPGFHMLLHFLDQRSRGEPYRFPE
ncbi:winged helix-turn-helix domain-containing protein [Dictyobacter formicarum]|uniref:Uncharacterized protein n=1 Tax=Dictyobacter formicarum TaxID=2778368 RepID=A0ABQ3VRI7_9CHLR|nr:winged helix-turn-helix domain-containing protein [Dictyobacter formicarum]GHO88887.1 hypothetical protein KSZ_68930 [Dictyobacter formicarum]